MKYMYDKENKTAIIPLEHMTQYNKTCLERLTKECFKDCNDIDFNDDKFMKHFKTQLIQFHDTQYVFIKRMS